MSTTTYQIAHPMPRIWRCQDLISLLTVAGFDMAKIVGDPVSMRAFLEALAWCNTSRELHTYLKLPELSRQFLDKVGKYEEEYAPAVVKKTFKSRKAALDYLERIIRQTVEQEVNISEARTHGDIDDEVDREEASFWEEVANTRFGGN